jgi:hypothetical protein
MIRLLDSHYFQLSGEEDGPAARAGVALSQLGARVEFTPGPEAIRLGDREVPIKGTGSRVWAQYVGIEAAADMLVEGNRSVNAAGFDGLTEGLVDVGSRPQIMRCLDGWLVVRWRNADEEALLAAAAGGPIATRSIEQVWFSAQECRLLVAPVLERSRLTEVGPTLIESGRLPSHSERRYRPLDIVDWTSLWAGPAATGRLATEGAHIVRIEHPKRRDGYLTTAAGRRRWRLWNQKKRVLLADAGTTSGNREIALALTQADVLVEGHTPRVLPQLGFDKAWFARHAPHLFTLSLVAYEDPFAVLPGTGEQAAAVAGLLWEERLDSKVVPRPWADPLLSAWALLVVRAWNVGGRPRGMHIRLSLEAAAASAAIECRRYGHRPEY